MLKPGMPYCKALQVSTCFPTGKRHVPDGSIFFWMKHNPGWPFLNTLLKEAKINETKPTHVCVRARNASHSQEIHLLPTAPTAQREKLDPSNNVCVQMLVESHGSQVPDTFEALESLPGVGHKTAGVVMSQVFR